MKNIYLILGFFGLFGLPSCDGNLAINNESSNSNASVNGSYSSMLTLGNKLYTVSKEELTTFDITDRAHPILLDQKQVGFQIENLYHTEGVLFIGSQTALHIFALNQKGIPEKKSTTNYSNFGQEVQPCDPVIANDGFAYATLSSRNETGGPCSRAFEINELRTYNVINLEAPILESTTEMLSPKGLSIDDDRLYVCEGEYGLKIFDLSQKQLPQLLSAINSCQCYDIIIHNGLILAVGKKEIYQYTYGDNKTLIQLKTIQL